MFDFRSCFIFFNIIMLSPYYFIINDFYSDSFAQHIIQHINSLRGKSPTAAFFSPRGKFDKTITLLKFNCRYNFKNR